jgi:KDO2-lipid IV(A) lauroyltransferase
MTFSKLPILRRVFSYFGHCSPAARLRWGAILGWFSACLMRRRVHIVNTNLRLCFPDMPRSQRKTLVRRHFRLLGQSIVDRGLFWFGDRRAILDTLPINGLEHLEALLQAQRPIILLAPHFIGLDGSATRLTLFLKESATLYTQQADADVDQLVREGRGRFNQVHLISRRDGIRGVIRHLRKGVPVYYLPDMDFGRRGAVFVPFFGIPAATLTATAHIAGTWNAAVVPIISRLDEHTGIYHTDVMAPLADFPGDDSAEQATARLSLLVEEWVRRDPAQYYWVHRRFKTRPQKSDPKFY